MRTRIKIVILILLHAALASGLIAQRVPVIPAGQLMEVGTYYYPEQWPEQEWERDMENIRRLGFEFTHFGEFAWSSMEPEEGRFDFGWLDKAIDLAGKQGLKVIPCTPTPTPPAWLTHLHPDVLIVNDEGRTIRHGARQHASWNSPAYRRYVERIVTEMARRYGQNELVWGWQIDNEPSHYSSYDYSENAQQAFQQWLRDKYVTIGNLNTVWGNVFWSQSYNDFDQVLIPNPKELVQQANPHAMLDFQRFTADQAADFVLWQQELLKKQISPRQWVTTNLMADHTIVDPLRFKGLDHITYTKYMVFGEEGHGEQGFRMGRSTGIGVANDLFRNINGTTGVMELQPGQVNWGVYNPQTMPGAVRMWIYHVLAGGNKYVCNYRFRQPLSGGEQYHYGIMQPDGVSVSTTGAEYVQFTRELEKLREIYDPAAVMPERYRARRTAMLYHPDNRWETGYQPQSAQWDFMSHFHKYYGLLQSFGAPVDIIDESRDFGDYPVLIAPAYQLLDSGLVARWETYVRDGGHLVLTCRTGQKNRNAHLWNDLFAAPILPLAGAESLYFDVLPAGHQGTVKTDLDIYSWDIWADIITSDGSAETWASYADQFYAGKAAVTHKKIGTGSVTYIGIDSTEGNLEEEMLRKIYDQAGIAIEDLPEGVVVLWRHGFGFALNYTSSEQAIPIPQKADILFGGATLHPAEVVVWRE